MSIEFIPVITDKDIATLAALADEIWHEYYLTELLTMEQIDYMVEQFQSPRAITDQVRNQGYRYYFMRTEGGINVGYVGVHNDSDGRLFLSKLYIHGDHRGHGHARHAFRFIESIAREDGMRAIWLTVNRYNDNSVQVYLHNGFFISGERVHDIGRGFVMDDFLLEKTIV